jgi:hypothetical protein
MLRAAQHDMGEFIRRLPVAPTTDGPLLSRPSHATFWYNGYMSATGSETAGICPECGAPMMDGLDCWEQLGMVIGWEGQDPELAVEHFLTVASYNLQHPAQFTEEALVWLRAALIDYLEHGTPVHELRQRAGRDYQGEKRVLKKEAERRPVRRDWSMTIADVYIPDKPQGAAARVRAWAGSITDEL